ncbi:hypothetical protein J6590_073308 [Homalodisca vitripennis]|nr:hypothetical protein J6590_073308 [Homalodisca vitripennis]
MAVLYEMSDMRSGLEIAQVQILSVTVGLVISTIDVVLYTSTVYQYCTHCTVSIRALLYLAQEFRRGQ